MLIIKVFHLFVKGKKTAAENPPQEALSLFLSEGLAVGALIHGRVCLMGTYQNLIQGAVVLAVTVIGAGLDGTFDALVCIAVHFHFLL